jgi:phenylacetate-coenzyme A ligase PaaK-like adenylate-forming protein
MNDLVVLGEKCPCGSRFRTIDHILGRNDDVLHFTTQDQRIIPVFPDLISRWIITASDDIREYQVHQTKDTDMEVKIEVLPNAAEEPKIIATKVKQRVEDELREFEIRCEVVVTVTTLPLPEDRSKYKRFIVEK